MCGNELCCTSAGLLLTIGVMNYCVFFWVTQHPNARSEYITTQHSIHLYVDGTFSVLLMWSCVVCFLANYAVHTQLIIELGIYM